MEKRSSMKDSGLSSLFRVTEMNKPPEESQAVPQEESGEQAPQQAGPHGEPPAPGVPQPSRDLEAASSRAAAGPSDSIRRSLIQPSRSFPAVIRVVVVGGAGTNAVNRMLEAGL